VLTVEQLIKTYGAPQSRTGGGVRGITFEIGAAEFYTLLGPSGCGKTTALRSVAGLELPSSGRISIDGRVMFDAAGKVNVPASGRGIGMVFQSYAVWPHMTVWENVAFPLQMQKHALSKPEIDRRVHDVLTTVGLDAFSERSAQQLSGGQQQRLSLARALVSQPKLLLLDEPLSNLDAALRDQMRIELRRLQKEAGVATLYVTHDQSEALAMSDRIAVMRDGLIEQIGTPRQIYYSPANLFVAGFVGRTNMIPVRAAVPRPAGATISVETTIGNVIASAPEGGPGRLAAVAIRPEFVELAMASSSAGAAAGPNRFPGRIEHVLFYGDAADFEVRLASGDLVTIRMLPTDAFSVSSDVIVHFPQQHVICLPEESSATNAELSD